MGLLTIIRKNKLKEKQIRVLILKVAFQLNSSPSPLLTLQLRRGLDNAGKTTVVKKLLHEDVDQVSPTLGFNIRTIIHLGYSLNVWDIGGQTSLRPYWRNYFETTDAVIWVVDSSDRERMGDCRDELKGLLQEERLAGASLLVFANKQDIAGALTPAEISEALELPSLKSHTSHIQPCSARSADSTTAKEDRRVWEGLDWVVKEVANRVYYGSTGTLTSSGTVRV